MLIIFTICCWCTSLYIYNISNCVSMGLSIIFHLIYGAMSFQVIHFSFDDCDNVCTSSYYHHQIGNMNHEPLFRIRAWNIGMCCMSSYVLSRRHICTSSYFHNQHHHKIESVRLCRLIVIKPRYYGFLGLLYMIFIKQFSIKKLQEIKSPRRCAEHTLSIQPPGYL